MRTVILSFIAAFTLIGSSAQADELKNLKLRIEGHVKTMMDGQRTPLLNVKDYYSTVYLTSKATVEELTKKSNGDYSVTVKFETTGRIHQNAEKSPIEKSEVKQKEDIKVTLSFRVEKKSLKWLEKLDTPFVKVGSEKRYIVEIPDAKVSEEKKSP